MYRASANDRLRPAPTEIHAAAGRAAAANVGRFPRQDSGRDADQGVGGAGKGASLRVENRSARHGVVTHKICFLVCSPPPTLHFDRPTPGQSPHPVKRAPHRRLEPVVVHAVHRRRVTLRAIRASRPAMSHFFHLPINAGVRTRRFPRTAGDCRSAPVLQLVRSVVTRVGLIPA